MGEYRVQAMSRQDIREETIKFKKRLGLNNTLYFPVVELFEILPEIYDGLTTEIVEDYELPDNRYAETDIIKKVIRIKQSIYDGAINGGGFERTTIIHEVGHYHMLVENSLKLSREFANRKIKAYEDPEWQAKCFAGEFMVTKHLVKGMNPEEISVKCGVSLEAARYQYKKINGI